MFVMSLSFTRTELQRYSRHILLQEVGAIGQAKLRAARVLVVGAGGLGSPLALYLAAAGVGTLGLVDHDVLELSNLQRQVAHSTARIGQNKAASAAAVIAATAPEMNISYTRRPSRTPIPRQPTSTCDMPSTCATQRSARCHDSRTQSTSSAARRGFPTSSRCASLRKACV